MNEPTHDVDRSCDSQVADLLDEFTDRLNRGEEPDVGDYVRRCPEQATAVRQALEALLLMRQPAADIVRAGGLPVSPPAPGHLSSLGDFRSRRPEASQHRWHPLRQLRARRALLRDGVGRRRTLDCLRFSSSNHRLLLAGRHASPEAYEGRCGVAGRERLELAFGGPQKKERLLT